MKIIKVKLLKDCVYKNKEFKAGKEIDVTEHQAKEMNKRGLI